MMHVSCHTTASYKSRRKIEHRSAGLGSSAIIAAPKDLVGWAVGTLLTVAHTAAYSRFPACTARQSQSLSIEPSWTKAAAEAKVSSGAYSD